MLAQLQWSSHDNGWYRGIWCDSSWELAYIVYNLNHNISVVRNTDKFPYIYNNRVKYYYPDFIVDNEYIEIKGYKSPEWYLIVTQIYIYVQNVERNIQNMV